METVSKRKISLLSMQSDETRKVEFLEFTFFQFVFYWKISMHFDEQLSFLNTAQRNKPGRERNLIIEAINQRETWRL